MGALQGGDVQAVQVLPDGAGGTPGDEAVAAAAEGQDGHLDLAQQGRVIHGHHRQQAGLQRGRGHLGEGLPHQGQEGLGGPASQQQAPQQGEGQGHRGQGVEDSRSPGQARAGVLGKGDAEHQAHQARRTLCRQGDGHGAREGLPQQEEGPVRGQGLAGEVDAVGVGGQVRRVAHHLGLEVTQGRQERREHEARAIHARKQDQQRERGSGHRASIPGSRGTVTLAERTAKLLTTDKHR